MYKFNTLPPQWKKTIHHPVKPCGHHQHPFAHKNVTNSATTNIATQNTPQTSILYIFHRGSLLHRCNSIINLTVRGWCSGAGNRRKDPQYTRLPVAKSCCHSQAIYASTTKSFSHRVWCQNSRTRRFASVMAAIWFGRSDEYAFSINVAGCWWFRKKWEEWRGLLIKRHNASWILETTLSISNYTEELYDAKVVDRVW